jgi:hypothetical protein
VVLEDARRISTFLSTAFRNASNREDALDDAHAGEAIADAISVVSGGEERTVRHVGGIPLCGDAFDKL